MSTNCCAGRSRSPYSLASWFIGRDAYVAREQERRFRQRIDDEAARRFDPAKQFHEHVRFGLEQQPGAPAELLDPADPALPDRARRSIRRALGQEPLCGAEHEPARIEGVDHEA